MGIYIAEALGWVQKPLWEFTNAGGSSGGALSSAYNLVASGEADLVLAVGGDKISDADAPGLNGFQNLIIYGNDCIWEVPFGAGGFSQFSLLCQAYMSIYGITEAQAAMVSVKNHGNALLNPNAQGAKKIFVFKHIRFTLCKPNLCLISRRLNGICLERNNMSMR